MHWKEDVSGSYAQYIPLRGIKQDHGLLPDSFQQHTGLTCMDSPLCVTCRKSTVLPCCACAADFIRIEVQRASFILRHHMIKPPYMVASCKLLLSFPHVVCQHSLALMCHTLHGYFHSTDQNNAGHQTAVGKIMISALEECKACSVMHYSFYIMCKY